MAHTPLTLACVGLVFAIVTGQPGHAREKTFAFSRPWLRLSADLASDAMRREAEVSIREREKRFARLKALPPAHVQPLRVLPGGRVVREIIIQEPIRLVQREEDGPDGPEQVVASECFDQVVYGTTGDASSGREHANTVLIRAMNTIERSQGLTPAHKQKLWLAGQGDIKRLFDAIDDKRKEFELVRRDLDRCEAFLADLLPLRSRVARGPFESDSLFIKTFRKLVNEEKSAGRRPPPEQRAFLGR
jgi:hypothetical protein